MSSTTQPKIKPCDCDPAKIAAEKALAKAEAEASKPKSTNDTLTNDISWEDPRGKPIDPIGSSLIY